jgi:Histidinol-phosphate/aromatic aminotransferase and cobyric acid decarboxylase
MTVGPERTTPLTRAGLDRLSLYGENAAACATDLSDNTNLWGTPPAAERVLRSLSSSDVRRYPSAYTSNLKTALAAYAGVEPDMIVTGCGSDNILDCAIRAFGNPGGNLACCDPTFTMIPVFSQLNGLNTRLCGFDENGNIRADELLASDADVIYICSPNNPTGASASPDRIEKIATSFRGLVIIDQAYAEYSATSLTMLAMRHPNVLIARTMSKVFGMAGLRIGYGIGRPAIVREIEKSRGPYMVGASAQAAAMAALAEDLPWISNVVAETLANRARLASELKLLGYRPLPSDANFLLIPVIDESRVVRRLLDNGVGVRSFANLPGIGGAIRVTVGPWNMMQEFLDALGRSSP